MLRHLKVLTLRCGAWSRYHRGHGGVGHDELQGCCLERNPMAITHRSESPRPLNYLRLDWEMAEAPGLPLVHAGPDSVTAPWERNSSGIL